MIHARNPNRPRLVDVLLRIQPAGKSETTQETMKEKACGDETAVAIGKQSAAAAYRRLACQSYEWSTPGLLLDAVLDRCDIRVTPKDCHGSMKIEP